MCKFLVAFGNGKALLGMPDIDMVNIINNISIGTEYSRAIIIAAQTGHFPEHRHDAGNKQN